MNVFNFLYPQLLLPLESECIRKRVVSQVHLSSAAFCGLKQFYSMAKISKKKKLLKKDKILLICECSLMKEYYNGAFHYKVTSFELKDNVDGILLSWIKKHLRKNVYGGILLSDFEEVSNIAFSYAIRHLTVHAKCFYLNAIETVVSVQNLYEGMYGHDFCSFNRRLKQSSLLQIDGISRESRHNRAYALAINPAREILEDRYSFSQFTILSTNLDCKGLKDYFGARLADRLLNSFLRIQMKEESYV